MMAGIKERLGVVVGWRSKCRALIGMRTVLDALQTPSTTNLLTQTVTGETGS